MDDRRGQPTSRRTCRSATWRPCAATTTGLDGEALAERLVRNAAGPPPASARPAAASPRSSGPPPRPCCPRRCCSPPRRSAVVAIELKLIGELHEVYGVPVPGVGGQRAIALVHVLGAAARRQPDAARRGRRRGARHRGPQGAARPAAQARSGRNLTTLGPFLTGAAVASYLNRRATRSLGDRIRNDLRKQQPQGHRRRAAAGLTRRCSAAASRSRVARADHPVRRRVGRVVQHHLHGAADPRPLHHERQRVGADAEHLAPPGARPAASRRPRTAPAAARRRPAVRRRRPRPGSGPATTAPTAVSGSSTTNGSQARTPTAPIQTSAASSAAAPSPAEPQPPRQP